MSPALAAALGALVTSAILAVSKKFDSAVTASPLFRKLQPALTLAGAFLVTILAGHGAVAPGDPVTAITATAAPAATVGTIILVELLDLLKGKV